MQSVEFQTFGTPHLVVLALTLALPVVLVAVSRKSARDTLAVSLAKGIATVLLVNEVVHWAYRIEQSGFMGFVQDHMPLHACGVSVLVTAVTLLTRNQRTYEIAYFWGLVAATNAVITPSAHELSFPGYRFFQYFTAHSGIVVGVLFATLGLGMRPTLGGLFRAFGWLNAYALLIAVVNLLLGTNYLYLCAPPTATVTPFFFAPWPWYIAVIEVIALAMFLAILSPFLLASRVARRVQRGEQPR